MKYRQSSVPWELPEGVDPSTVTFEVTEYRDPTIGDLTEFLKAAPDPDEWVYEGYENGGYQFSWTGKSDLLEAGVAHTVHFHVHGRNEKGQWVFGGAWVERGVSFKIAEVLKFDANVAAIALVADHFEGDIAATMEKQKDSKSK
jgi:hypothetical protein